MACVRWYHESDRRALPRAKPFTRFGDSRVCLLVCCVLFKFLNYILCVTLHMCLCVCVHMHVRVSVCAQMVHISVYPVCDICAGCGCVHLCCQVICVGTHSQ